MDSDFNRRRLIQAASGILAVGSFVPTTRAQADQPGSTKFDEVSPPEDLMREHGVLNRVLLIYEAALGKFARREDFDVNVISRGGEIIREFIEGYHERNEEQHVFPRFRQAGQMVELVKVLYQQHQAGRRLTDMILSLVPASVAPGDDRQQLIGSMQSFIAMYRPHEAREDTDLFPKLRTVVSANEFDSLAEEFERDERRKFGQDGFEAMVARVAALEVALGIDDLARVTPT